MTVMWRPEGWKNPFDHSPWHQQPGAHCQACGFEAGADAILKELRNSCLSFAPNSIALQAFIKKNKKGRLVFIPEEAGTLSSR